MTFELAFFEPALKGGRSIEPCAISSKRASPSGSSILGIPSAKLHGHPDCYKIKLRGVGYRLVYEVRDEEVIVLVIAVGRRERDAIWLR